MSAVTEASTRRSPRSRCAADASGLERGGNIGLGETAIGRTWVPGTPKGARFARHAAFADANGRDIVTAISTWAMLDKATGRPARVTADIAAAFQP